MKTVVPRRTLLGAGVEDADGDRREAVGEAGAEDVLDVGHPAGRPDASRAGDPPAMVAGDDVGVEAEAGHEEEPAAGGAGDVHGHGLAGGDRPGQSVRVAPQAEVAGDEVLGAGRHDGQRRARPFVEQRRDRAIAPDGHEAAAVAVVRRPAGPGRSVLRGVQATSAGRWTRRSSVTSSSTRRRPRPDARAAVGDDPDPGRTRGEADRAVAAGLGRAPISCAGSFPAA